ncbi:MAG: replication initiation protein [Candidatus Riflebacteria bacterium]|nr:replication initiation protein [Candidatus Riflebacteria bacterium]
MDNFLDIYKPTIISASSALNDQEKQLLKLIASKVEVATETSKNTSYTFNVKDVYKYLNMPITEDHKPLRKFTNGIMKKIIEFRKGESFLLVSWLSSVTFYPDSREVVFGFDPYMLEFYRNLHDYFFSIKI